MSAPGRCRACRWWSDIASDPTRANLRVLFEPRDGAPCTRLVPGAWGYCVLADPTEVLFAKALPLAVGATGRLTVGALVTYQDFGCVQFEARDPVAASAYVALGADGQIGSARKRGET